MFSQKSLGHFASAKEEQADSGDNLCHTECNECIKSAKPGARETQLRRKVVDDKCFMSRS